MKKLLAALASVLMVAVLAVSMVACSQANAFVCWISPFRANGMVLRSAKMMRN